MVASCSGFVPYVGDGGQRGPWSIPSGQHSDGNVESREHTFGSAEP